MLVERFGWTLREIGETDIEEIFPFVAYYPYWKEKVSNPNIGTKKAHCDQVNWL